MYGMSNTYTRWIHHGEPLVMVTENVEHLNEDVSCNVEFETNEPQDDPEDDQMYRMVQDLYPDQNHGPRTKSKFATILEEMKQVLHPGGPYTRFSFVVKLLHIKSFYRISNVAFSAFLDLLSSAFPNCSLPASYAEAKNFIRALGLGYESIHVCPNNCVLFRKELAKMDACPICGASRWRDADSRRQIPEKVLRHFPLRGEIPIILCKLEKIFPPAFFDVMVHLCIHLIDDAILRVPVQYGWMYPVERRLLTLKRFVRKMARPEGSIAEA
ncbi:Os10g0141500, partial [Oryza sativa Japonica Group]